MKRIFDIFFSAMGIIILFPIFLIVALAIKLKLGSPIFFTQSRPGLNGIPFQMIKFRSMLDSKDAQGEPLPNDQRLTRFGRILRSSSLDELPELWNVFKGDMSLVGPRPLLIDYLPLYTKEQFRRHEVKPGVTGWAQINGRNAISWEEKFNLDIWYVENRSIWLDSKIIILTIKKILIREGINSSADQTMPRFTGAPSDLVSTTEKTDTER
ncbi:sugar transferase [Allopusillimonas ginsengisoli]|uniref:sugar transferase n=1 Tax=Allopusillimonas ginsengisoli TaxID=453575 RepID=UPI001021DDAD|nr:sugar transferase [Allopusillimonas ginsengisoli]TEA79952.1 sugar transferase [Allopusillimonas ginsengisoli]